MTATEADPTASAEASVAIDELLDRILADDAPRVVVADGDLVCRLGDTADTWWYVDDGWADVTVDGIFVGNVGTGETIGEIAAIDGHPRTATVTARGDMQLRVGTSAQLTAALAANPRLSLAFARLIEQRVDEIEERTGRVVRPVASDTASDTGSAPGSFDPPVVTATHRVEFDPFAPGYFDDPTVQLNAIREQEAVHRVAATEAYFLTRYEHVQALARDRRLGNSIEHALPNPVIDAEREMLARIGTTTSILRRDGDEHARVRRLLQKAFTPKVIATWRERTEHATERLLDQFARQGGGDLIADYGLLLPVQIISDMVGMPTDDLDDLRDWSHVMTKTFDPLCSPDERAAAVDAQRAFVAYIEQMYQEKRRQPDDGLLSMMIAAEDDGERLTHAEVIIHTITLFIAGHETTTNLIGNGSVALFRNPDQRAVLVGAPDLDANVVEEVLRYDSPVQMLRRISVEDIDVDGTHIPAGSVVTLCSAAANRDPRKWGPTADRFRVARPGANDQVSFGGGPHFCLGAALARLEGQIALPRLFRRFPTMRPTIEPAFEQRVVLRSVGTLPVEI